MIDLNEFCDRNGFLPQFSSQIIHLKIAKRNNSIKRTFALGWADWLGRTAESMMQFGKAARRYGQPKPPITSVRYTST